MINIQTRAISNGGFDLGVTILDTICQPDTNMSRN